MAAALAEQLRANIARVILGKNQVIEYLLTAFFAEGHVLLEDVPGVGKTMLGRALAASLDLTFHRLQFTSDLLPADVVGVSVFHPESGSFQFKAGPVFANVVLADELNRTPPRTQSSLLEALEDHRVTVDGIPHELPQPFLVIATQNPLEFAGTYPLPESELDRFLLCTRVGYPDRSTERRIVQDRRQTSPLDGLAAVASGDQVLAERRRVREVRVDDAVMEYLLDLVEATRRDGRMRLGASPRASLAFERAARALAHVRGRDYCIPEDVKELAVPVLAHRVVAAGIGDESSRSQASRIIEEILDRVAVPT